jgi:hypothetical protein
MKNDGIQQQTFDPVDLVVVKKQVQSNKAKGVCGKLLSD